MTVNDLDSFGFSEDLKSCVLTFREQFLAADETMQSAITAQCNTALNALYQTHMMQFVTFLQDNGFELNSPNDTVLNTSPDGLLLQCSTKAAMVEGHFLDQTADIPGSYVEFAYRGLTKETVEQLLSGQLAFESLSKDHRRDGFEVGNADKIFESTFTRAFEEEGVEGNNEMVSEAHLRITEKMKSLQSDFSQQN